MANNIDRVVQAYARRLGLDSRAVLAIATHESSRRRYAVGDKGTSFGPFQLHRGGALPTGKGLKWAGSDAGIWYAMQQMANSGARGKTGRAAVSAISRNFERPANPAGEISHAMSWYKGSKTPVNMAAPGPISVGDLAGAIGGGPSLSRRKALMDYALGQSQALIGQGEAPSLMGLMQTFSEQEDRGSRPQTNTTFSQAGGGAGIAGKAAMLEAIRHAQKMGLHVSENEAAGDAVDPVHVAGSYHYKKYPGSRVNEATDVSGNSKLMARYYKWARSRYGKNLTELFYDPLGGIKYGKPIGAIGGHKDHVHIAFGG